MTRCNEKPQTKCGSLEGEFSRLVKPPFTLIVLQMNWFLVASLICSWNLSIKGNFYLFFFLSTVG